MTRRRWIVALTLLMAILCGTTAWAQESPSLYVQYRIQGVIADGRTNYDVFDPAFSRVYMDVQNGPDGSQGSLTLSNGRYTYGSWQERIDGAGTQVANADRTFPLSYDAEEDAHVIYADRSNGLLAFFWGEAETNFSNLDYSFTFANNSYSGTLPRIRSLQEQMASGCVPYFELVMDDGKLVAIDWRFVDPEDSSRTAVVADSSTAVQFVRRIRIWPERGEPVVLNIGMEVSPNTALSGRVDLDEPMFLSPYARFDFEFRDALGTYGDSGAMWYRWSYDMLEYFVQHRTRAELYNGTSAYDNAAFDLVYTDFNVENLTQASGTLMLENASYTYGTYAQFDSNDGTAIANASEEFPLGYSRDDFVLMPVTADRDSLVFWGAADTGLTERTFNYEIGGYTVEGVVSPIRSTGQQLASRCVPYIAYIVENGMLTGVNWRFVDQSAPTVALRKSDNIPVNWLHHIRVQPRQGNAYVLGVVNEIFENGDLMEGRVTFPVSVDVNNVRSVRVRFSDEDYRDGENSLTRYEWFFEDRGSADTSVTFPNVADLAAARNAVDNDLATRPAEVVAGGSASVTTSLGQILSTNGIDRNRAAAAIGIEQSVAAGGAVVVATGVSFPVVIPQNSNVGLPGNFNDLRYDWNVNKYFESGIVVDLLDLYGSNLFSLSGSNVVLGATMIVVDDVAPADTDWASGGGRYGVKLTTHNGIRYLYIFDGTRNGIAKDPIVLETKEGSGDYWGGGGSSGCDSGFPTLLLTLSVPLAMYLRRKR